ncbi:MAG: PTS sugar transporter subunit IIC [Tissierellia bacterium]|nr:PTS sugar transporter subunit IIC [Tissierellia bacterium]
MLLKSIIIAIWAGLCALDQFGPHLGFRKPLLAGVVVGFILGKPTEGLIIAATLELMWLGTNNVGAYQPPDVISGSIVGVAIGILSNKGQAAGVAVAIPVALLVQQLSMFVMTANITWVHAADKAIESGEFGKIDKFQYLGALFFFLSRAIPVFLAVYMGSAVVEKVLNMIPENILNGLTVASKIIPAVGIAMLLSMMMKKNMWIFLTMGFTLATFLELPIIAIALLALCAACLYDILITKNEENLGYEKNTNEEPIEQEYDL